MGGSGPIFAAGSIRTATRSRSGRCVPLHSGGLALSGPQTPGNVRSGADEPILEPGMPTATLQHEAHGPRPGPEVIGIPAVAAAQAALAAVAPVGHLRVVDAADVVTPSGGGSGSPLSRAYLDVGARVVRVTAFRSATARLEREPFHAVVVAERPDDIPGVRLDDADLILWDGGQAISPRWLATRVAAGGVIVAPAHARARLLATGLAIQSTPDPRVLLARDPRPARSLPPSVQSLDRTMCVDRARVLEAAKRPAWRGPSHATVADATVVADASQRLLTALHIQLAVGEPDVRRLPWPRHVAPLPQAEPGCDVLVVGPHPDDETIYLGGTIAGLVSAGARVHVAVATNGAGGRGGSALGPRRASELLEAAGALGVRGLECLGWADTGKYRDAHRAEPATAGDAIRAWDADPSLRTLVQLIRRHRPRTLLGLGPEVDPNLSLHGHHLGLGVLLAVAFHLAADPGFDPGALSPWAADEHRVAALAKVAGHVDDSARAPVRIDVVRKRRALEAYASQAYSTRRLLADLDDVEVTRSVQARRHTPWRLARAATGPTPGATVDWRAEAARITAASHPRAQVAEVLRQQAATREADPAVLASIERLRDPRSVAVVTGQQVGWLGGPAYTLVKALGALALARRIQAQGVPAVPVFWMATQDHDELEARTAPRLDAPSAPLNLRGTGGYVGRLVLDADVEVAIESWLEGLPEPTRASARALAERHYRSHATQGEAFASLLAELSRGTGLLILDPDDPTLAELVAPIYARDLLGPVPAAEPLAHDRGRVPEVVPTERDVTQVFFTDDDGRRVRLRRTEDGVSLGARSVSRSELTGLLDAAPQRFSPAALLRPVVQDALLPAVATLAGPTEARYLQQAQVLYPWAQVVPSRVVERARVQPRASEDLERLAACGGLATLEAHAQPLAALGAAGLPAVAQGWLRDVESLHAAVLAARQSALQGTPVATDALRSRLEGLRVTAPRALSGLRGATTWQTHAPALDALLSTDPAPTARGEKIATRFLTRAARRLHQMRAALLRDGRRRADSSVAAWSRVRGAPERRLTVVELVARHGAGTPASMLAALQCLDAQEIELVGSVPR